MVDRVPQPALVFFAADETPKLVRLGFLDFNSFYFNDNFSRLMLF